MFRAIIERWRVETEQVRSNTLTCPHCRHSTHENPDGQCDWCGALTSTQPDPPQEAGDPGLFGWCSPLRPLYAAMRTLFRWAPKEQAVVLAGLVKWTFLGAIVGVLTGSASALFLTALTWATQAREFNPWTLWLLPLAGLSIGVLYQRWGSGAERGNNLILDNIHETEQRLPLRMAPFVLVSTVVTHLFGGSAGREGTAVQMGGSLAEGLSRLLGLTASDRRLLLMSGMSGGFGSVFGTPLAGTLFGMEVLRMGALRYNGLTACLSAAFVGDWVTVAWGVPHTQYLVSAGVPFNIVGFGKAALMGIAFGLVALGFSSLTHGLRVVFRNVVPHSAWRPVLGGAIVILLTYLVGTRAYLGLSLPLITESFLAPISGTAFLLKLIFTALTLGSGFQGGEVTPLFVIGATLGSALSAPLGLPSDLSASMGFVAVFAAAANTPLACLVMAVELFGTAGLGYTAVAAFVAYLISGHSGIYHSQRIDTPKQGLGHGEADVTLDQIYAGRPSLLPALPGNHKPSSKSDANKGPTK
jgi:H+/Cl- antiporter ClcA